jgi:hypothetical protein
MIQSCFLYSIKETYLTARLRIEASFYVLTAIQDIFLSYNMFLILEERKRPDIIRDENREISYPLLRVLKSQTLSDSVDDESSSYEESSEEEDD